MAHKLTYDGLDAALTALRETYRVFAPVSAGGVVRYGERFSAREIVTGEQSAFSPKEIWMPIVQTLFFFRGDECAEAALPDERPMIVLARACDICALERLDTIYLENGGQADSYYARLREKLVFFLLECTESFENCFCVSMGTNETENFSAALRFEEDRVLVSVRDARFDAAFADGEPCGHEPVFIHENKKTVPLPEIGADSVAAVAALPFWEEMAEACIGCGGCNAVCPTCSCFDTVDVIYSETSRDGERRRVWGSCMREDFAVMAGGGGVRRKAGERLRFKVMHKVYDYKARFGKTQMCVGCGRCDARCPKDISYSEAVTRLAAEVRALKGEGGAAL